MPVKCSSSITPRGVGAKTARWRLRVWLARVQKGKDSKYATIAAVLGGRVANLTAQEGGGETITHYQQAPGGRPTHSIEIQRGSHLATITEGAEAQVNSFHRQSVADPGYDLAVSARARDGVIEAVEGPGQPFLVGVQFHPEQLLNRDTQWLRLFEMFVRAARRAS